VGASRSLSLTAVPIEIRDWGEAFAVVYSLSDARTHLLPAAGAELLRWMAAAPAGVERDEIIASWAAAEEPDGEAGAPGAQRPAGPPEDLPTDPHDAALLAQRVDELIDRLLGAGLLRAVAGPGNGQP